MSAVVFTACAAISWLFIQTLKKIAAAGSVSRELLILFTLINNKQAEQSGLGVVRCRASVLLLSFSNHYLLFVNLCFMKMHGLIYHINQKLYPLFTDVSNLKTFGEEINYEKGQKRKYVALLGACGAH